MNIPKLPELAFDERTHIYKLNGIQIPSVTMIMRPLSAAYYGGIDENILATAAKRGKDVHNAIENWLKFQVDDIPPENESYYQAFKSWWDEKKPKRIESEGRVYHKILRYAGTADLLCMLDDPTVGGLLYGIDFKTSAQIVEMLVRVQLEAYERAYQSHGIGFDAKAVVHLRKDGTWEMKTFPAGEMEPWEVFCGLLTAHNYLSKYRR